MATKMTATEMMAKYSDSTDHNIVASMSWFVAIIAVAVIVCAVAIIVMVCGRYFCGCHCYGLRPFGHPNVIVYPVAVIV